MNDCVSAFTALTDPLQSNLSSHIDSTISAWVEESMQPLLGFLSSVGFEDKDMPSQLVIPSALLKWTALDDRTVIDMISPGINVADEMEDRNLKMRIAVAGRAVRLGLAVARLMEFEVECGESRDKNSSTKDSAAMVKDLNSRATDLCAAVQCAIVLGKQEDLAKSLGNLEKCGNFPVKMEIVNADFVALAQSSAAKVEANLVEWEPQGETLLKPESQALVDKILGNPGRKDLASLATKINELIGDNRGVEVFPEAELTRASAAATSALKLVSVAFTLCHIAGAWPKIKGWRNQEGARVKMKEAHATSAFKDSWECLPGAFKSCIDTFGAK
ncbi:unnamed protein product [Prorocentrum cordatum]|uniref:Uncharacterized protein n=1 Tax=Prorocentrum cordatum TaxID=2364126 RepID=A0ABN9VE03_9DINO|nr:unnamed protein product [Polarella glacialis]